MKKIQVILITILAVSPILADVNILVRETAGISRTNEFVSNGIPLSRVSGYVDPANLQIQTQSGTPMNAQFEVLSRWAGGLKGGTPIQWLMVTFPATVPANGTTNYKLITGSHSNSGTLLSVANNSSDVTVNTGVARFKISKTKFNIFEEAVLLGTPEQNLISNSGNTSILVDDKPAMTGGIPGEVRIEHLGDQTATVKVAGKFTNPPYAGVLWTYVARYRFFAGSPTVELDFYFAQPGNNHGTTRANIYDSTFLVKVRSVKLTLPLSVGSGTQGYGSAEQGQTLSGALSSGQSVAIKQQLRPAMLQSAVYTLSLAGTSHTGTFAEKPYVAVSGAKGGLGVSIQKMKYYEPQQIVGTPVQLEVHVVTDSQWISPFMGAYAKLSFTLAASASGADWNATRDQTLAAQDHKIMAWPERAYAAHSGALDEIWDGTPNADAQMYYDKVDTVNAHTIWGVPHYGMQGFMTYGVGPRYWYKDGYGEYGDITRWDGYFLGGAFTDYHNTFSNVVRFFAQNGDAELLNQLSFPAARRTLNTQIIQGDSGTYHAGWAPSGYAGYRNDENSSHSYFENLYFYYYLTGDRRVLEVLSVAGNWIRHVYNRYADGTLVPSTLVPIGTWMGTTDRVGSQFAAINWFLGHASDDSTYLSDVRNQYERMFDRHLALLNANGKEYGITCDDSIRHNPGAMTSSQSWMISLYCLQNLWRLYQEFGDLKLGVDSLRISQVFKAINNTYWDYIATVYSGGNGSAAGTWTNQMNVTWSGARLGGTLTTALPVTGSSDPALYLTGKACITAFLFHAAYANADTAMYNKAVTLAQYVIRGNPTNIAWDKVGGESWLRTTNAAAYLAEGINAVETAVE
ncbi:MAG: hypothetical protein V1913_11065, partial [Fibrobacterota bacterium]